MTMHCLRALMISKFFLVVSFVVALNASADQQQPIRVFIFAGQSNMVGSDSKVRDIERFPPFAGLDQPQPNVRFAYCLGRENKTRSDGWVKLQPVNDIVGPELSFARKVSKNVDAPIAIIKCAAGGTHLGGDWNPDQPQGFKMYPLALQLVRDSLAQLDEQGVAYRLEGFVWHQGENDMFNEQYMANYGKNLANFIARWRRDLNSPNLKFYVGELCTKTIWGMDLRPRMYAISLGQKAVAKADPNVTYVPTSHVGVEIGGGVGLHYHYGTLGQLEHGINYADAYLTSLGKSLVSPRPLPTWPLSKEARVRLFVLAGHRNMEGERAFRQQLGPEEQELAEDRPRVPYRYSLGGGYRASNGWEPLGLVDYYDTFGPELSFARTLERGGVENFVIVKFTHSGSQMNDWTPAGTEAKSRHIYPRFIEFVNSAITDLKRRGHQVELAGVFYHVGENEMSMPPYRQRAAAWLAETIIASRRDLNHPRLRWYVSQQRPTDHERVNQIDVTKALEAAAADDPYWIHLKAFDLGPQEKQLVLNTGGVIRLGEILAKRYLKD